jgi:DNA-binding NarL/FixJ family response regulator
MGAEITLLIADDHPLFRKGLQQMIESDSKLKIVAEAADGEEALERIQQFRPQIAILDVDMPQRDGFEVVRAIREQRLPTLVVFLTMHKNEEFFNAALNAGVRGYVLKDSAVTDIVHCIRAVVAGENFISPALSTYLIHRGERTEGLARSTPGLNALTPAERGVLKLIAEFKTTKEIADELCISPRTVDHHRANIAEKLGLRGKHALSRFAVEHQSSL